MNSKEQVLFLSDGESRGTSQPAAATCDSLAGTTLAQCLWGHTCRGFEFYHEDIIIIWLKYFIRGFFFFLRFEIISEWIEGVNVANTEIKGNSKIF